MCELGSFGYKQAIAGISVDGTARRLTREGLDADIATADWQAAGYISELARRSTVFGTYTIRGLPSNYTRVFVSLDADRLHGPRTLRSAPNSECDPATCSFDIEWTNGHAVLRIDTNIVSFEDHAHGSIYVKWEQPVDRGHDTCELATCEPSREPGCEARLYTANRCQFGRCGLALVPPLTAMLLCIAVMYWFPEIFFTAAECHTPARLEAESAKVLWRCRVSTLVMGGLMLLLLAFLYIKYFSCCGEGLCTDESWETDPFVMLTDDSLDSLAVHHVASRAPDGSLRVDQCRDGTYTSCDRDDSDGRRRAESSDNNTISTDSRRLQAQGGGGQISLNCVGSYGAWSICPQCGGQQTRSYIITQAKQGTGTPCPAAHGDQESQPCTGMALQDCQVSWGDWSACPVPLCVGGTGQKTRSTQHDGPFCGGAACPAVETESQNCTVDAQPPADCTVGWRGWSACNAGTLTQTRVAYRTSNERCGGTCNLQGQETRACTMAPTPCSGDWTYSDCFCSVDFNGDVRGARNRTYVIAVQGQPQGTPCPHPSGYMEEQWSGCNHILADCCVAKPVPQFLTADYLRPPCPIDCAGEWSCWSACSLSCGGGVQVRHYEVSTAAAHGGVSCSAQDHTFEERSCNEHACPICELPACTLAEDARPIPRMWPGWCCCWGVLLWLLLAALPLALALANLEPEPEAEHEAAALDQAAPELEKEEEAAEEEEFTMWILFLLDPNGIRHAVEVMSSEWSIETIYDKALAATGIPIEDQILLFGGRRLKPGKQLTSYGVQHGSEIVIEAGEGKVVQTRQGKQASGKREIKARRGRQAI